MNEAACIDCGVMSERRLPERFPHICTLCLFPPRKPDPTVDPPDFLPVVTSIEGLQSRRMGIGRMFDDNRMTP